jgi:uncharacterized RDD family membrane protein YckC
MQQPGFVDYRRGFVAASIMALVVAVTASSHSDTPLPTFLTMIAASGVGGSIGILLVVAAKRPTKPPDALGLVYGGFWLRFAAYLIDVLTIGIPAAVLTSRIPSLIVLAYIVLPVYFVVLWATTGRTFGMMVCGLRVVRSTDGRQVSWGCAILRLVGFLVAAIPLEIGLVWAAFDERKRGWHDMIAGTVVVRNVG